MWKTKHAVSCRGLEAWPVRVYCIGYTVVSHMYLLLLIHLDVVVLAALEWILAFI